MHLKIYSLSSKYITLDFLYGVVLSERLWNHFFIKKIKGQYKL